MPAVAYQAEFAAARESHICAVMGRREGKSWMIGLTAAFRMGGVRVRLDGQGFEPDPFGCTDQAFTSASDLQSQALLRGCYEHVERLAKTGLLSPDCYPGELNANSFALRNGTTARAFADNPRTIRGGASDWNGDEICFSRSFADLYAAASLLAAPTLQRPEKGGYRIRLASSAYIAGTTQHQLLVGDGTEANDRFRHYRRWNVPITDAVRLYGFPRPGMTVEEQDEFLDTMRGELGDAIWNSEMMCVFINGSECAFAPELLQRARYGEDEFPSRDHIVGHYAAADIARSPTGDLSCRIRIAVDDQGVMWALSPETGRGASFDQQSEAIAALLDAGCKRVAVDASGMGAPVAEALVKKFGRGKIDDVVWSAPKKTELFEGLHHALDRGRLRIPNDVSLLRDLSAFRRVARVNGTFGFDAPRGPDGHGDRGSALAMCVSVANIRHERTTITPIATPDKYAGIGGFAGHHDLWRGGFRG